jgi:sn-glycerol 3-phosphate transport system substrate-binding protein
VPSLEDTNAMRRPAPLTAALLALALVAAGCGDRNGGTEDGAVAPPREEVVDPDLCPVGALDEADGPVEITMWHSMTAANNDTLEELTADFNDEQDQVRVRLVFQGDGNEPLEAFRAGVRSGTLPAVAQLPETFMQEPIDLEAAIPVEACMEASGFDVELLPRVVAQYTVADTMWPMPFNISAPLLYYNRTLFEEAGLDPDVAPTTLEEIRQMSQAIVDSGAARAGFALQIDSAWVEQLFGKADVPVIDNSNGREIRATEATLDETPGPEIFTWVSEMLADGLASNEGRDGTNALIAIVQRNAAMGFGTTGALGSVYDILDNDPGLAAQVDPGIAPMPNPLDGEAPGGVNVGGAALWITDTGSDADKAAAWEYVSWLVQPEQQSRWHMGTGYVPVTEAAITDEVDALWQERPGFRIAYDQLTESDSSGGAVMGGYDQFRESVNRALERVASGTAPEAALEQATRDATGAIEAYNRRAPG